MGTTTPGRKQIGQRYEVVKMIGEGGSGKVYMARDTVLDIDTAIKVLHPGLIAANPEKLKEEAKIIIKLNHPNIVRMYGYNVENGTPYLVTEYASNGSLRQLYPAGTLLPLSVVVSYVIDIAAGLYYAHSRGIVHCDIKPENLFQGANDEILIGDFDIAECIRDIRRANEPPLGTIPYIAPEQIWNDPSPASDQYSLAIVVFEWLTGTLPFTGPGKWKVLRQHLEDLPPSLRALNPQIPEAVEQVVLKALSKDPADRFTDVQVFATALQDAYINSQYADYDYDYDYAVLIEGEAEDTVDHPLTVVPSRKWKIHSFFTWLKDIIPFLLLAFLACSLLPLPLASPVNRWKVEG